MIILLSLEQIIRTDPLSCQVVNNLQGILFILKIANILIALEPNLQRVKFRLIFSNCKSFTI